MIYKKLIKCVLAIAIAISIPGTGQVLALDLEEEEVNAPLPEDIESDVPTIPVTENVYGDRAMMAAEYTEFVINPGESYEFSFDVSSTTRTIYTDASQSKGIFYDYVVYGKKGDAKRKGMDRTGVINFDTDETVVISIPTESNPMTVKIRDDATYSITTEPALLRFTLQKGESYRLLNVGPDESKSIASNVSSSQERRCDYSVYNADGKRVRGAFYSVGKPQISPDEELIITGATSNPVTIGFPYRIAYGEVSDEPAYLRIDLNPGESYELTNLSTKTEIIQFENPSKHRFDYVIYKPDGTEHSHRSNSSSEPSVQSGFKIVITLVSDNPTTIGAPYRAFEGSDSDEAIHRITVSKGESYIISNNSSKSHSLHNDAVKLGGTFDYVTYRADGARLYDEMNSKKQPGISSGASTIVTVQSDIPVTFEYTDDFSMEYTGEPAYVRATLTQGQTHEFTNRSEGSAYLRSDSTYSGGRFDYVIYYPDGTERSRGKNSYSKPSVPAGHTIIVTNVTDIPITFGGPYRIFAEQENPGEAIQRITVNQGESYVFHNNGSRMQSVRNDAPKVKGSFDYVVYESGGNIHGDGINSKVATYIPAGGYAIVTSQSLEPITFEYADTITIQQSSDPSHLRVTLTQGKSYEFTNVSTKTRTLNNDATISTGGKFDYVIYRADDTESSSGLSTSYSQSVAAGNRIVVTTVSEAPVTFIGIYTVFKGQENASGTYQQITINKNESYAFLNKGLSGMVIRRDVTSEHGLIDTVVYDAVGKVASKTTDSTSSFTTSVSGKMIVTVTSATPVVLRYNDGISVEKSAHPAMLRALVAKGNSYSFTNISDSTETLFSLPGGLQYEYAYILTGPDGHVQKMSDRYVGTLSIPAGYNVVVTTVSAEPITFAGVYTSFQGGETVTPGKSFKVNKDESYVLVNQHNQSVLLENLAPSDVGRHYDYAVYDVQNIPLNAQLEHVGNVTIPAGGTVVITGTSELPVLFKENDKIIATPSKEPALLKRVLELNQQVMFQNKTNSTAHVVTDASKANAKFYDFVAYKADGSIHKQGTQVDTSVEVSEGGNVRITVTSNSPVKFGAPYRAFTISRGDVVFEELLNNVQKTVIKQPNQTGYYKYKATRTGVVRFVTKEKEPFELQPVITLYADESLTKPIKASKEVKQVHGEDYTVLEYELTINQVYYLTLEEEKGKGLDVVLVAASLYLLPKTTYQYNYGNNTLSKITLYTGDEIQFEYDARGNLIKRTKKVYPFR